MRSVLASLVAVTIAMPASAQCTSYMAYGASTATSISLYQGTGWSTAPPISAAVSMWKTGCFGMAGRDFPYLSTGTGGQIRIDVSYVATPNPVRNGGCGRFDHDLGPNNEVTGGTIEVFQKTNAGHDCAWAMAHVTLDNLIAHELGHVLGLANATSDDCDAYIMGNHWAAGSIQEDECESIDDAWDLPNEPSDTPPDGTTCLPGCTTPIIITLRGEYRLTNLTDGATFDIDADGVSERVAWPERDSGLAFLTTDRNANGRIDDGSELFGEHTPMENGVPAANGFEALGELDVNGDGTVDSHDPGWSMLLLWFDNDLDGQSSPAELVPIYATEVIAIDTYYKWSGRRDRHGNMFRYQGEIALTSGVRRLYDVYLRTSDQ